MKEKENEKRRKMRPYTVYTQTMLNILKALLYLEGSQKATADSLGISPQYLCDVLKGRRDISETVGEKLGYRKIVTWEKIGGDR